MQTIIFNRYESNEYAHITLTAHLQGYVSVDDVEQIAEGLSKKYGCEAPIKSIEQSVFNLAQQRKSGRRVS